MNPIFTRCLCASFACIFAACDALVVVDPPKTELTKDIVFSSDKSASSAISGLYGQLISSNFALMSSGMTLYGGMSADEIYNSSPGLNDQFTHNSLDPFNATINTYIWNAVYKYIYSANAILEGLESGGNISKSTKEQLKGEALFIRAFCYFYLINLFGGVPYIESTDYETNRSKSRATSMIIYDKILSDLLMAEKLLSVEYPTDERLRVNKWVVKAMLARVYLYRGDYLEAIENASDVLTSQNYRLIDDPTNVFQSNSDEAIWQLRLEGDSYNTWEGVLFIPQSNIIPNYIIHDDLIAAFEPIDKRLASWVGTVEIDGRALHFPYKYKIRTGTTKSEYYMVLRLAEQYLIRAEAYAQLGMIKFAADDLDKILSRAGVELIDRESLAFDQQNLLDQIYIQRRLELFCEWGNRWLDLKRTGRLDSVMVVKNDRWTPNASLYPIPGDQLIANPALEQNPGY